MTRDSGEDPVPSPSRRRLLRGAAIGLTAMTALAAEEVVRPTKTRAEGLIGRFRGTIVDNNDPLGLGRVRVLVPDVLGGTVSGWALPSSPYAGSGVGLFALSPIGANVWVEFEEGDPDRPVWAGGFWGEGEIPPPADPDHLVLMTPSSAITLDNARGGGITVESTTIGVLGNASFSRSGVATVGPGSNSATVRGLDLSDQSFVLATLQDDLPGVFVRAAVPDPAAGAITVYLTRAVPRGARVAWLVLG